MKYMLQSLSERFDCIIVDLPPLGAAVDARAISPHIDCFVTVVEWGRTRRDVLEEALANMAIAKEKIVGAVLNKVNFRQLNNIYGYSPGYYYNKSYGKYGYSDA
jgi:polysaccharide biosynthesis transport protein